LGCRDSRIGHLQWYDVDLECGRRAKQAVGRCVGNPDITLRTARHIVVELMERNVAGRHSIGLAALLIILGLATAAGCKTSSTSEFLDSLQSASSDLRTADLQVQLQEDIEGMPEAELVARVREYVVESTIVAEELRREYEAIDPPSYIATEYANFVSAYSDLVAANHRLVDELLRVETKLEAGYVVFSVLSPAENNFTMACFALQEAIDRDNVDLNCGSSGLPGSSPALISLRPFTSSLLIRAKSEIDLPRYPA